jgi:hypothetical protein
MLGACPRCRAPLELPASGTYTCERCRKRFEAYLARPVAPVAAPVSPAVPLGDARCAAHANNPAVGNCERCGDFMCSLCSTPIEGRNYCLRCFELLHQRGSLAFDQRAFNMPGYSLILGLISVPCMVYGLAFVTGPAAVVLGLLSLRKIREQPGLPGRGQAIAGIILGGLAVLGLLGLILFTGWKVFTE